MIGPVCGSIEWISPDFTSRNSLGLFDVRAMRSLACAANMRKSRDSATGMQVKCGEQLTVVVRRTGHTAVALHALDDGRVERIGRVGRRRHDHVLLLLGGGGGQCGCKWE